MDEIVLDGKTYVSAKHAAKQTGYTKDYIGQLCRAGKISACMIGRNWYIEESVAHEQRKSNFQNASKHEHFDVSSESAPEQPELAKQIAQEGQSQSRLTPSELATKLKQSGEVTTPSSRHERHRIEEAFPMSYTVDDRPLIPTPVRRPQTATVLEEDTAAKESESTPAKVLGRDKNSSARPSEFVADARAVRISRFGSLRKEDTVLKNIVPKSHISLKRDVAEHANVPSRAPYVIGIIVGVLALATLYASVAIEGEQSYVQSSDDSLGSQLRDLDAL